MTARVSAATERALKLIARGVNPQIAAKKAGIHRVTIFRAMKRAKQKPL